MPDGVITFRTDLDNAKLEKELAKLTAKIKEVEKALSEKKTAQSAIRAELTSAKEEAKKTEDAIESLKSRIAEIQETGAMAGIKNPLGLAEMQAELKQQEAILKAQDNEVAKLDLQYTKVTDSVMAGTDALNEMETKAGEITDQINQATVATSAFASAAGDVNKRLEKISSRIGGLVSRVFVFSMITSALRSMRTWMSDVITANNEASAALARLKGALLTMVQPLVQVVIPAFTTLVNILTAVIGKIAAFISALGGKTVQQTADAAKALNDETKALQGVSTAAKGAGKSLAGFDEINRLDDGASSASTSGSTSTEIEPDFSWTDGISETLARIADDVLLIGAGLALWKIGESLPGVLGEIATTLGGILITVGGLLLMWDGLSDAWENGVDWENMIEMVLGLAAAAGGLYIAFGSVAAGISLVVGGLALLVTGFRDAMESGFNLQNTLLSIAGIIATGLGITLLTGSLIPLLIASIAALLLAFTVATGHGEELISGIQEICEGFVDFFTGIFSGDINKSIGGIEKIFEGLKKTINAVFDGLMDTILSLLDWLDEKTGGKLHWIIEDVEEFISGAFDNIKETISGVIDGIKQIFSGLTEFLSGVFTGDWDQAWEGIKDIFKGVFNAVVSLLEGAVNAIIGGLNWLISQMNKISFTLPDWVPLVGGKSFGINIKEISEVSIPRLAQGAVIPPNREFMAVLGDQKSGTNIEAPLDTIKQAVAEVLGDFISSNVAGHEATVAVLEQILEAVLGIEIGPETVAEMVNTYNHKMAIVRGRT